MNFYYKIYHFLIYQTNHKYTVNPWHRIFILQLYFTITALYWYVDLRKKNRSLDRWVTLPTAAVIYDADDIWTGARKLYYAESYRNERYLHFMPWWLNRTRDHKFINLYSLRRMQFPSHYDALLMHESHTCVEQWHFVILTPLIHSIDNVYSIVLCRTTVIILVWIIYIAIGWMYQVLIE